MLKEDGPEAFGFEIWYARDKALQKQAIGSGLFKWKRVQAKWKVHQFDLSE